MKKFIGIALFCAVLSCKGGEPKRELAPGTLSLDKGKSNLTAVAIKNETKAVELQFPDLDGALTLAPFKATLEVNVESLSTGDKGRDGNIKMQFFEIAMAAANKKAVFTLNKLEGDLNSLSEGSSFPMKGGGTLSLHGATLAMSGPLTIKRLAGGGFSASFKDLWVVNIKDMGMLDALENLNKNCPQPHRVGLNVALKGELVYVKK